MLYFCFTLDFFFFFFEIKTENLFFIFVPSNNQIFFKVTFSVQCVI